MPEPSVIEKKLARTRYPARIMRASDLTRMGLTGAIVSAYATGLVIVTTTRLDEGEELIVECENQFQRFCKKIEGKVESVRAGDHEGLFEVSIESRLRLSPTDTRWLQPRRLDWA